MKNEDLGTWEEFEAEVKKIRLDYDDAEGQRVAVFVLCARPFTVHGNRMPVVVRYGPHVRTHRRHILQQSDYTLCFNFDDECRFERYDNVFDDGPTQQGICRKFTIPASERRKVLTLLDEANVNAYSLFGSEESLMETFTMREFFLRTSEGQLS